MELLKKVHREELQQLQAEKNKIQHVKQYIFA